jgi:tetratricopeptide (TPR) repeat protein
MSEQNKRQAVGQSPLTVDEAYKNALDHFNALRYTEADQLCTAIIQVAPNHILSLNLLGIIAQKSNRHDLAIKLFQRAINIDNSPAILYYNLGMSLKPLGRRKEAIEVLQTAMEKEPGNDQIARDLNDIINISKPNEGIGNTQDKAQETLQKATFYHQSGQLDEAIKWYKKTLEIQPENTTVLSNIGAALQTIGKLDEAVSSYQKAIAIKPSFADAYFNLGLALQKQDKLDEAVINHQKAIAIKPGFSEAHSSLGFALQAQGKLDEAVVSYQKAIAIKPDFAEAYSNLGFALKNQGKLDKAITCYQKAIAFKPDYANAHHNLSHIQLLNGDFHNGWNNYSWRWKIDQIDQNDSKIFLRHKNALWEGEPLNNIRILVWSEQWVGESILFASIVADLIEQGADIVIECDKRLVPLFTRSFTSVTCVPKVAPSVFINQNKEFDFIVPFGNLCRWLSNTTAHMAGSLGVPTMLMLGAVPIWYWMMDRDDSPWYSSLHLFRQKELGDWGEVVEQVSKAVKEHIKM